MTARPTLIGLPYDASSSFLRGTALAPPVIRDALHSPAGKWESTLPFSERMHLTTSRDILDAIAAGEGPESAVIALGYAGWEAGQLDEEMARNAWLTVSADERLIFETPVDERWQGAARLLGINLLTLSSDAGHA